MKKLRSVSLISTTQAPIIPIASRGGTIRPRGDAGFLIVTYDEITQLTTSLQPYMDLMSFDVRVINQLDYHERVNELRAIVDQNRP